MNHEDWINLLPFYVSGSLDSSRKQELERHLSGCIECRKKLAEWRLVKGWIVTEDTTLELPPRQGVFQGLAPRLAKPAPRTDIGIKVYLLLRSQFPLIQQELWLASAVVFLIGFFGATLTGVPNFFKLVAPLITAASIAVLYGPEHDPVLELSLSTPTSPHQILLARLVLVFFYDLVLALIFSLGLLLVMPVDLLLSLILGWLGPMAFLSALALVLSLGIGTRNAVTIASLAWLTNWAAYGELTDIFFTSSAPFFETAAIIYTGFFSNTGLLMILAALLLGTALWMVDRQKLSVSAWA